MFNFSLSFQCKTPVTINRECSKAREEVQPANDDKTEARESNYSQLFKNAGKTVESITQQRKTTFQQEHKEKLNEVLDKNRELSGLSEEGEMGNLLVKDVGVAELGINIEHEREDSAKDEVESSEGSHDEFAMGDEFIDDAEVVPPIIIPEILMEMENVANDQNVPNDQNVANVVNEENDGNFEIDENFEDGEDVESSKNDRRVKYQMTKSKWFAEIPDDFPRKWLVKLCPKGKRRLIICSHRTTRVYDKQGYLKMMFNSNLPGGGGDPEYSCSRPGVTVLDCVFHSPSKTFYVLDMMVWNSARFLDCEAEMRFFWIRTKYTENPELFEEYGKDSFKFTVLFDYAADPHIIAKELSEYDQKCKVSCEGVLFYHKEAPYVSETTTLVGWLKPFMLSETLDIIVPDNYADKRPKSYVNLSSHLELVAQKLKRSREKRKKRKQRRLFANHTLDDGSNSQMDTEMPGTSSMESTAMETPKMETSSIDPMAPGTSKMDVAP